MFPAIDHIPPSQVTRPQDRRPRARWSAVASRVAALASAAALGGCATGVLDPQGPIGAADRTILLNSLAIMLAIVIPTIVATLWFAWWFRASNTKAQYLPDWAYSGRVELVVWSIPLLVIVFLGGIAWIGSHDLDPGKAPAPGSDPLEIQVVSLDWKWLFLYPDQGVATVNQLVVPANKALHFTLTSASVMNAFFVPQLGSMIYTMNGMTTFLNLQADHEGQFYGRSAHFSGDGFPGMQFNVTAVSKDAFDTWVETTRNTGATLDRAGYDALAKQSMDVPPATFRSVEPNLFESIVNQTIPPAPGPEAGQPQRDVSPRTGG